MYVCYSVYSILKTRSHPSPTPFQDVPNMQYTYKPSRDTVKPKRPLLAPLTSVAFPSALATRQVPLAAHRERARASPSAGALQGVFIAARAAP